MRRARARHHVRLAIVQLAVAGRRNAWRCGETPYAVLKTLRRDETPGVALKTQRRDETPGVALKTQRRDEAPGTALKHPAPR